MKPFIKIFFLLAFSVILFSCNMEGDENIEIAPGSSLEIIGDGEVKPGDTASYAVDGYTIKKTYTWTVEGASILGENTGPEITVIFNSASAATITVDNGKYKGTMDVTVK